jgi:hypothetical protein
MRDGKVGRRRITTSLSNKFFQFCKGGAIPIVCSEWFGPNENTIHKTIFETQHPL